MYLNSLWRRHARKYPAGESACPTWARCRFGGAGAFACPVFSRALLRASAPGQHSCLPRRDSSRRSFFARRKRVETSLDAAGKSACATVVALFCLAGVAFAQTPPRQFDVVVYEATPGGISAAISAARLGHTVALIEQERHIGGLST